MGSACVPPEWRRPCGHLNLREFESISVSGLAAELGSAKRLSV